MIEDRGSRIEDRCVVPPAIMFLEHRLVFGGVNGFGSIMPLISNP